MRGTVPVLLASLALAACDGGPTPEKAATRQALVGAHVASAAVSHLVSRYAEMLGSPATDDTAPVAWEAVAPYRQSPEGLAEAAFLGELARPVPVEPSFTRAKDIEAVGRATSDLVNLALAPAGSWQEFSQGIAASRGRLDAAVAALEKGTKSYVLIDVRQETNMQTASYTEMLAKAKADAAALAPGAAPAP